MLVTRISPAALAFAAIRKALLPIISLLAPGPARIDP